MINHEMENQQEQESYQYQPRSNPSYEPQKQYQQAAAYYDQDCYRDDMQPRASIMTVRHTDKLQELREKCFQRLSNQRQQLIKERRFSQMPQPKAGPNYEIPSIGQNSTS